MSNQERDKVWVEAYVEAKRNFSGSDRAEKARAIAEEAVKKFDRLKALGVKV